MPVLSKAIREMHRDLARVEDLFDRWFSDFLPLKWPRLEPALKVDWAPAVDLIDRKDHILVRAETPGVKRDDLEVLVTSDSVTIKGKVQREEEEKGDSYYYAERVFGSFGRVLRLPQEVDSAKATAKLQNGILEIKLPKKSRSKPDEVKVQVK